MKNIVMMTVVKEIALNRSRIPQSYFFTRLIEMVYESGFCILRIRHTSYV
ncbi:protein of unknown function [Mesotoga infera]|uniref:Uncharacterized protein n=1 Tax=Mesotoga infera TaxID=1236046 RepID=A0A7Z7PNH3_9BACT|nr:protein of unknown function [Mesotoga infera]